MSDSFGGGTGKRKADGVADAINRLLQNLVIKCAKSEGVPDEYARLLFMMSSVLPENLREASQSEGYVLGEQASGFAFNADLVELIRFLDIGTRPSNLR